MLRIEQHLNDDHGISIHDCGDPVCPFSNRYNGDDERRIHDLMNMHVQLHQGDSNAYYFETTNYKEETRNGEG